MSRWLVVGIGNRYRRDDGVGLHVVEALQGREPPGVELRVASGEGASLMELWSGFPAVCVVDAVSSGQPPGTIHELDAAAGPVPQDFFHYSTHAFSLAEAVEMGRALGELPPRLLILGIEGADFRAGEVMTPAVAAASQEVAQRIQQQWLSTGKAACTSFH